MFLIFYKQAYIDGSLTILQTGQELGTKKVMMVLVVQRTLNL